MPRVLTAWLRDLDFCERPGRPRVLEVDDAGFAALVRRYSGDMSTRAYVPQRSAADQLHILGSDVADLIATIDHNLQRGGAQARYPVAGGRYDRVAAAPGRATDVVSGVVVDAGATLEVGSASAPIATQASGMRSHGGSVVPPLSLSLP